ncbi:unnamed protein product [Blepharisma stoltei]|uniref:EF-hand domain-containing protein n=1 Tax=Blepharisma stoltei TaxID=1481888 RepID=A0AAU9JEY5_9CILI|nr:unnamed protein product [Blepharisma stoltei]
MDLALNDLLNDHQIKDIFHKESQKQNITVDGMLPTILDRISSLYGLDLEGAQDYFRNRINFDDEEDIIDPLMITWEQFQLRLANFLAYITGTGETVIKNIKKRSSKLIKNTPATVIEKTNESRFIRKGTPRIIKRSIKARNSESPPKVYYEKPQEQRSWISPYLNEYFEDLVAIFQQLDTKNQGMIDAGELKEGLRMLLKIMKVKKDGDLFLFDRMIENRFKLIQPNSKTSYSKVSLYSMIEIIEEWALKESYNKNSLREELKSSIDEYQELLQQFPAEEAKEIRELVNSLKEIEKNLYESKPAQDSMREKQIKGLKFIFNFYARQTQMFGKSPTFDELTKINNIWNIGKFFKFCTDFGIMGKQNQSRKLSKSDLTQIFQVSAENSLAMNETSFMKALDQIADLYYNNQFDALMGEHTSSLSLDSKKSLLYQFLDCGDSSIYMQKVKGFGLPFSSQKEGFRIDPNDLSKNYKPKISEKRKQLLRQWKQKKLTPDLRIEKSLKFQEKGEKSIIEPRERIRLNRSEEIPEQESITWNQLNYMDLNKYLKEEEFQMLLQEDEEFL